MLRNRRFIVLSAVALMGAAVLTGCSSKSADSDTSSSQSVVAPVIIEVDQIEGTAKVGDTIVFNVDKVAGTTIATEQADLLAITQAKEEGGAQFNPGAKALAPGSAVVTITNPDSSTRDVLITITE